MTRKKLEEFFVSAAIRFITSTTEDGENFYLIERSDLLPVLSLAKSRQLGSAHSLDDSPQAFVPGVDDFAFLTSAGVRFTDVRSAVLFCEVAPDGRWVTKYKNSPISRITPPIESGGVFADGVFLTERSIAFQSGEEVRLQDRLKPQAPVPIDIVYTWVDSSDPRWMVKKAIFSDGNSFSSGDNAYRYLSRDELKYSIRSIQKHAPWVRNIYVITDEQRPSWLKSVDNLKVVDHREIFPDKSVLPVFNSHAIESCLHRIPGLSEFFIYFNDDVFLGKPVEPSHFFDEAGRSLLYISQASFIDPTIPPEMQVPTDVAAYNMQALLKRDFGFIPTRKMMHTPHPLRKSVMEEICAEYREQAEETRRARVRSTSDLAIPSMFYPYFAWATGRAVLRKLGSTKYKYFDTGKQDFKAAVAAISKAPPHFFCANVTYHEEIDTVEQARLLEMMFKKLYPSKSRFEY